MSEDSKLVTIVGTICKEDPTLRFTPTGIALCVFGVRVPGTKAKEGKPATEATFHNITCWRELAENVAESLKDKDRVIVRGIEKTDTWEGQDGQPKSKVVINAWNVGPDLSYATASVVRNERKTADAAPAAGSGNKYQDF